MENKYFKEALREFVTDFADGDAVRVMADKGYPVSKISKHLDFPISREKIGQLVWNHYVNTGVILLNEPKEASVNRRITYEKVQDSYGRTSFKQVVYENKTKCEYIACDFGKRMYQNRDAFCKSLEALEAEDREYILGLPWPLQTVWHVLDDRMKRIQKQF